MRILRTKPLKKATASRIKKAAGVTTEKPLRETLLTLQARKTEKKSTEYTLLKCITAKRLPQNSKTVCVTR